MLRRPNLSFNSCLVSLLIVYIIRFISVKRADGFQQMVNRRYETAEDKYLMGTETQNLMVAAFILVRGILFGRVEEVQLRKQKVCVFIN